MHSILYSLGQKAYTVHEIIKSKILVSRDVIFYENIFSYQSNSFSKKEKPIPLPGITINDDVHLRNTVESPIEMRCYMTTILCHPYYH